MFDHGGSRRFRVTLGIAAVLHGLAAAWFFHTPHLTLESPEAGETQIDLLWESPLAEPDEDPPTPVVLEKDSGPRSESAQRPATQRASTDRAGERGEEAPTSAAPAAVASADASDDAIASDPSPLSPQKKINLGLDGSILLRGFDSGPKMANLPQAQRDVAGLKQALRQKDARNGLGKGGPVVQAARTVVKSIGPGTDSSATLSFSFGEGGQIRSVALLDASSSTPDWDRVVTALKEEMKKRPLKKAGGAYRIVMRLETRNRKPSGMKKGGSKPQFKGLSLVWKFDASDINEPLRKTVHVHILSEEKL